ncbi:hypothetical protein PTSG_10822 [Salpingoeca rosetta]|uniref:Uncharacterized protein n=1 Tax=Salpingoeca rosetta (strain ATCC 50818 / BSB-021) TaxID=946362 RepID=F2URG7_SALR5|nr:uncharacterized protein PTSG_10822 [Salpingoeca rosetta]EGD80136.1 hypothetical protein PTSG_10822 [Salpingoeca rosetta]|eukprot:XP_004988198.1 hypothetical protein PTSG_10822 [Salpingoeca rosetta]
MRKMMACPRLIMTVSDVAIHWMPLVASMEQNVGNIGKVLLMAGQSDCFQSFMSAEENELFDTVQRTAPRCRCTIALPMAVLMSAITAHGVSVDALRTCPSFKRPPLPTIDRAIRTAIRDGRTAPMTCPRLTSSFQAPTCRADCMHGTYSGNIESMRPVSAAIERNLSS